MSKQMYSIISTCKSTGICKNFTTEKNCFVFSEFFKLTEHVEESKENVLTSPDIMKRMNGNLNSNTLIGKEIKKLFKHVQVKITRTKRIGHKSSTMEYFGKQMQPSSYLLQIFQSCFHLISSLYGHLQV